MCESFLVGPAIAAMQFRDDDRTHLACNFSGSVGGVVIDNDYLVDELRQVGQYLLYSQFLVEAWNDYCDPAAFVHAWKLLGRYIPALQIDQPVPSHGAIRIDTQGFREVCNRFIRFPYLC
jgi:hypothetical protein